jgi:anaerobic magnesium-protoporphyrin IX monomethyl ester cyclase
MRVFLLYPPISKYERYSSDIGHSCGRQIPLGIFYLASFLRNHGHTVYVVDAEAGESTASSIAGEAKRFRPDLIGISATTVAFHRALEAAVEIKNIMPDNPIVLGGPHVTASHEDALSHEQFDMGVRGEGEHTLLDLVNALSNNSDLFTVDGLAFKQDGRLITNPARPLINDIDDIPFPAYDLIPDISAYNPPPSNYKRLPVANIITSRGCPNQCTFCGHQVFGRTLRQRSAGNIADENERISRTQIQIPTMKIFIMTSRRP